MNNNTHLGCLKRFKMTGILLLSLLYQITIILHSTCWYMFIFVKMWFLKYDFWVDSILVIRYIHAEIWYSEILTYIFITMICTYLRSILSFSQLPMKVPNWQEYTWSWRVSRKRSLNSKEYGNCCMSCHTESKNWPNTGDISLGSTVSMKPQRSVNLWPNDNHSLPINTCNNNKMQSQIARTMSLHFLPGKVCELQK